MEKQENAIEPYSKQGEYVRKKTKSLARTIHISQNI